MIDEERIIPVMPVRKAEDPMNREAGKGRQVRQACLYLSEHSRCH